MAEFDTTNTFVDGDVIDAASLNNIIDEATALPGLITGQGAPVSAVGTDQVLLVRSGDLKRANVSTLPSGVTNVSSVLESGSNVLQLSVTNQGTAPVIHLGLDSHNRRLFLATPVANADYPSFRAIAPQDTATVHDVTGGLINWSLSNVFTKSLTTPTTAMTFSNPTVGQEITVLIICNATGQHATFPTGPNGVYWAGHTAYVTTQGSGRKDILKFYYMNGHYYGNYLLDFRAV